MKQQLYETVDNMLIDGFWFIVLNEKGIFIK